MQALRLAHRRCVQPIGAATTLIIAPPSGARPCVDLVPFVVTPMAHASRWPVRSGSLHGVSGCPGSSHQSPLAICRVRDPLYPDTCDSATPRLCAQFVFARRRLYAVLTTN